MDLNTATKVTLLLVSVGAIAATPVLIQGFKRRGKGVKYERNFLIQRAPQLASVIDIIVITISFLAGNDLLSGLDGLLPILAQGKLMPAPIETLTSWLGIIILSSGLVFMIGGWYSLGECFSTDAELLEGQTIRKTGLLKFVMHPAYSGIIQSLLGASLSCVSLPCVLITVFVVAPLWLQRAKYEEKLLMDTFGQSYTEYGQELKWRRLVPRFFPIGI